MGLYENIVKRIPKDVKEIEFKATQDAENWGISYYGLTDSGKYFGGTETTWYHIFGSFLVERAVQKLKKKYFDQCLKWVMNHEMEIMG